MWLVAISLESTDIEHFHYHQKFSWTAFLQEMYFLLLEDNYSSVWLRWVEAGLYSMERLVCFWLLLLLGWSPSAFPNEILSYSPVLLLLMFCLYSSIRLSTGLLSFLIPWLPLSAWSPILYPWYHLWIGKCLKWEKTKTKPSTKYWISLNVHPFCSSASQVFSVLVYLRYLQIDFLFQLYLLFQQEVGFIQAQLLQLEAESSHSLSNSLLWGFHPPVEILKD